MGYAEMACHASEQTVSEKSTVFYHAGDAVVCALRDFIRNLQTHQPAQRFFMRAEKAAIGLLLRKPARQREIFAKPRKAVKNPGSILKSYRRMGIYTPRK